MQTQAKTFSLVQRASSLALNNIWRNKFLSLATIFVIGTIIFIFNIILAVNFIAKTALNDLNKKIDIIAYVKESVTVEETQNLIKDLSQIEGVEKVQYTSKEDAIKQLKKTHPDISIAFEKYSLGNPLPASVNIVTLSPEYRKKIEETLSQEKYQKALSNIVSVNNNSNNQIMSSVAKNLIDVNNFANQVIFWLIAIFIIGGSLIMLNAIHLTIFNRKREIGIMKLVGAPYWFIRLPFILESVVYGILAVLISLALLYLLSKNIQIKETNLFSYYSEIKFYRIFIGELLLTVILTAASSAIAVHEYILQTRSE